LLLLLNCRSIFQLRDGWLWRINVVTSKVIHNVEIDIVKFVVEIESVGISSDDFDKETGSSDELKPKQADLSCIHALNELHLHEICVVLKTIVDKKESSKQGRKIIDAEVNLENVYNLDMAHEETVLRIVFHDMEESTTRTASLKSQVKDKGKAKQSDAVRKYQALKRKPVPVAQARNNMMIYLKNMAGFKMDFFKGMSYEKIRPLFEEEYKKVQTMYKEGPEIDTERIKATRTRIRKEKVEKDQTAKRKKGDELEYDNT
nr:hypothetical protein [Tanacetum cinerariifolium]